MSRLAVLAVPVFALACEDPLLGVVGQLPCAPGFVQDGWDCVFDEAEVVDVLTHMTDGRLVKANGPVFEQSYGIQVNRNVWVSPLALASGDGDTVDLYRAIDPFDGDQVLDELFPVGTLIVHETVDRQEGHTVQVKRDDYVDENGRPWWFGKFFDDGTADEVPCEPCTSCHSEANRPGTDGLVGVPRESL